MLIYPSNKPTWTIWCNPEHSICTHPGLLQCRRVTCLIAQPEELKESASNRAATWLRNYAAYEQSELLQAAAGGLSTRHTFVSIWQMGTPQVKAVYSFNMFLLTRRLSTTRNGSKSGTPFGKYVDWFSNIQLSQEGIKIRHPLWPICWLG